MAKEKKHPTSKADFEYFKKHCKWWVKYLGMYEYKYTYDHEDNDDTKDSIAIFYFSFSAKVVTIILPKSHNSYISKKALAKTAFHEVFESSMIPLKELAERDFKNELVEEHTHSIIRRLENTLFQEKWDATLKRLR